MYSMLIIINEGGIKLKAILLLSTIVFLVGCASVDAEKEELPKTTEDSVSSQTPKKTGKDTISEMMESFEYAEEKELEEQEEKEVLSFGINEEAILYNEDNLEIYSIKIIDATSVLSVNPDISEYYTNGKPENTIQITYEYKNYNYGEPIDVKSQFFTVYDSKGLASEDSGFREGQSEVSDGKMARSTVWFVMDEPVDNIDTVEIEYANDFSLGFEGYISFEIPVTK